MQLKHWVFLGLFALGGLYLWHNYQMHGGKAGLLGGLGVSH